MHILAELTPLDPGTGSRVTLRVASAQERTITGLNSVRWWPAIIVKPVLSMRTFDGDFSSPIDTGTASLTLAVDGLEKLDANARRFLWAGAGVKLYAGNSGDAWPWTQVFDGIVTGMSVQANKLQLNCAVDVEPFNKSVLSATYAGTGGAEGGADLKNKLKPWVFGAAKNIEPVLINAVDNVYQFSGYGAIKGVTTLFERGAQFDPSLADYANYAALITATIPSGQWATCLTEGMIRLGAPAYGVITGDIEGDYQATTFRRLTGAILTRIATALGISADLDSASLTALDAAVNRNVNIVISEQTTFLDLAQNMSLPCNAQAGVSWLGKLFVARVAIGSPVATLDAQGRRLPPVAGNSETDVSPPYSRIEMLANRSWRVHTADEVALLDPADPNATVDLTLTAIGTSPPLIQGNKVTNTSGANTYETMVRGTALSGPCFAECNIIAGGDRTALSLDISATDKLSSNQDVHAEYIASSGSLNIFRASTTILSATITAGVTGKMQLAYDGVRYHVFVAGTEYAAGLSTYPGMTAAAGPLAHFPKWTPYSIGSALTGLREGPYTDNNFGSIGGNGTPDPYATGSDNLIANASLAVDALQWTLTGSVARQGASSADPFPGFFAFSPSAGSQATANNGAKISLVGATKLYVSCQAYKASGATGTAIIVVEWYRGDGTASAITTQDNPSVMPGTAGVWTPFLFALTPPSDAASFRFIPYAANSVANVYMGGFRAAKTEPAADVTSTAKVAVEMATDKSVAAAYDGTVASGDLSALRWSPKVTRGGVSIKGDNATSYALSGTYGGTFAVDNTNGSSTKGDITQSAITANTAGGDLTITANGIAEPKIAFKVDKALAPPPSSTGGGSTKTISWMGGDWIGINTTSYTAVNTLKSLAIASGETLYVTGTLDVNVQGNGGSTRTMTLKVQYSATGAGSWNDFPGGGHASSTATAGINNGAPDYDYTEPVPGTVTMTDSKGGLSAATYDVRVVGIDSATGKVCIPSGTLTVEAKV